MAREIRKRPFGGNGALAEVFEAHRRIVMGAGMVEMLGRVQREGETVHLLVERLTDLAAELAGVSDAAFPLSHERGGEFHQGLPDVDPRSDAIRVAPWDF